MIKLKRLIKLSDIDISKLEQEYQKMILDNEKSSYDNRNKKFELQDHHNSDAKTFLVNPQNLIDYENEQNDTSPRPGIPGWWASSMRWLGR